MRLFSLCILAIGSLAFSATEYDGNWVSGCADSSKENIKINGTTIDYTVSVFGDGNCSSKYVDAFTSGTLHVGPPSQSTAMAKDTEIIISKLTVTPRSAFVAMMMNSRQICGHNDWAANVAKNVAGDVCEEQQMPKIGDSTFDLVSLQNGKLLYGLKTEENDGSTLEKRPKELDTEKPFSKN